MPPANFASQLPPALVAKRIHSVYFLKSTQEVWVLTTWAESFRRVGDFGRGIWRYWRLGEPAPASNYIVQKLYAFTDGRSNDILFRILESKRKETDLKFGWEAPSLVSDAGMLDPSIEDAVRTLKQDGIVVLPPLLKKETVQRLYELALSCLLETITYGSLAADQAPGMQTTIPIAERGTSQGIDPSQTRYSVYTIPRSLLLENEIIQSLLCDPYLLAVATRYLGVFPVITKPDMWWDTDFLPAGPSSPAVSRGFRLLAVVEGRYKSDGYHN